jgi:hypothetical protein
VLTPRDLAAAACLSQGQLWDISNALAPRVIANIDTDDVDIWHSAAFTNDGKYVTFCDEYFGPAMEPFGAIWTYAVDDPSTALSHVRIPRAETKEIAFYDMRSNQWSTYWYNGLIIANDISRGVDVLRLSAPQTAGARHLPMLNPQTQTFLLR